MRLKPLYRIADTSWDVSGQFFADALHQAGVKPLHESIHHLLENALKSVLYEFDGPNGQLNRSLLFRNVGQPFTDIPASRFIELWGADSVRTRNANAVTYVTKDARSFRSFDGRVDNRNITVVDENVLVIDEDVFENIKENIRESDGHSPIFQVLYQAGIADTLFELPTDLKMCIYALARQKYDYRDDFAPSNLKKIGWSKSIISKYKMRHRTLV